MLSLKTIALQAAWTSGELENFREKSYQKMWPLDNNWKNEDTLFFQLTGDSIGKDLPPCPIIIKVPGESEKEYQLRKCREEITVLAKSKNYAIALKIAASYPISQLYTDEQINMFFLELISKSFIYRSNDELNSNPLALSQTFDLHKGEETGFIAALMSQVLGGKTFAMKCIQPCYEPSGNKTNALRLAVLNSKSKALTIMREALGEKAFAEECLKEFPQYITGVNITMVYVAALGGENLNTNTYKTLAIVFEAVGCEAFTDRLRKYTHHSALINNLLIRAMYNDDEQMLTALCKVLGEETFAQKCLQSEPGYAHTAVTRAVEGRGTKALAFVREKLGKETIAKECLRQINDLGHTAVTVAARNGDAATLAIMSETLGKEVFSKELLRPFKNEGNAIENTPINEKALVIIREALGKEIFDHQLLKCNDQGQRHLTFYAQQRNFDALSILSRVLSAGAFKRECLRPFQVDSTKNEWTVVTCAAFYGDTKLLTLMRDAIGDTDFVKECLRTLPEGETAVKYAVVPYITQSYLTQGYAIVSKAGLLFLATIDSIELRKACLLHKTKIVTYLAEQIGRENKYCVPLIQQLNDKDSGLSKFYFKAIADRWFRLFNFRSIAKINRYCKTEIRISLAPICGDSQDKLSVVRGSEHHPNPLPGYPLSLNMDSFPLSRRDNAPR